MKHFLLFYEVSADYLARRPQFRNAHLAKAWEAHARGELLLGGALNDPLDSALLLFAGESPEVAERFARADPYVTGGLVTRWRVREWSTVAGGDAASPVHPDRANPRYPDGATLARNSTGTAPVAERESSTKNAEAASGVTRHAGSQAAS